MSTSDTTNLTIRQHLETLPSPYREWAVENMENYLPEKCSMEVKSKSEALLEGVEWKFSKQGQWFWDEVYVSLRDKGTVPAEVPAFGETESVKAAVPLPELHPTSLTVGEALAYLQSLPQELHAARIVFEGYDGFYPASKEIRVEECIWRHPDSENTEYGKDGNELSIPGPFVLVSWDKDAGEF